MTLMGAQSLNLGGAPAGPAGGVQLQIRDQQSPKMSQEAAAAAFVIETSSVDRFFVVKRSWSESWSKATIVA